MEKLISFWLGAILMLGLTGYFIIRESDSIIAAYEFIWKVITKVVIAVLFSNDLWKEFQTLLKYLSSKIEEGMENLRVELGLPRIKLKTIKIMIFNFIKTVKIIVSNLIKKLFKK